VDDDDDDYSHVEVPEIIPYSLTQAEDGRIGESRRAAIAILNMLGKG